MNSQNSACLVCGHLTVSEPGHFEICPVCFWEDEGDIVDPNIPTYGPNGDLSLTGAKENYSKYGAIEKQYIDKVRPAMDSEVPSQSKNK